MRRRCLYVRDENFKNYGGRGIRVCDRWRVFGHFVADMGDRPAGMTLDRRDNDGNYEPGNCRWATWEQQANNRRNSRWVVIDGERLTVSQIAARRGLDASMVTNRLNYGWSIEEALTRA